MKDPIKIVSFAERSDLLPAIDEMIMQHWPKFMLQTSVDDSYWERLYKKPFAEYQFVAITGEGDEEKVIGLINSVALPWKGSLQELPDRGWDEIFTLAMDSDLEELPCDLISALSVIVSKEYRGYKIPQLLISHLKKYAKSQNYLGIVVPVRPTMKHIYPIQYFRDYITWKNERGEPFDPWIRTHWRLGAKFIKIAPESMRITGTIANWELWTGLKFPQNGKYAISSGLVPLKIDVAKNIGEYVEPNLWMFHPVK